MQIGRIDGAIVVNCSEQRLRQKLLQRDPQYSRPDDTTLAIENRLKIFQTETLPVIKHFENKGLLTAVRLLPNFFYYIINQPLCVYESLWSISEDTLLCLWF